MPSNAPRAHPPSPGRAPTRDLTKGPIFSTLFVFSLPILAGNVLQSLNGSVNAMWVGRFLGEAALTARAKHPKPSLSPKRFGSPNRIIFASSHFAY